MSPIVIDDRPRCDVCGHVVHVQSADEGTQHYEPDIDDCRERVAMLDELAPAALAAPALDVERLAKALGQIRWLVAQIRPFEPETIGDLSDDIATAYARLANPEKP